MKIIRNNILPFKGFAAINIFGVLFVRKNVEITDKLLRHEAIHTAQMKETYYIGFYLLYSFLWIACMLDCKFDYKAAYKSNAFEAEARIYSDYDNYLDHRPKFAWMYLL